jgi:twitching motility protein PilT
MSQDNTAFTEPLGVDQTGVNPVPSPASVEQSPPPSVDDSGEEQNSAGNPLPRIKAENILGALMDSGVYDDASLITLLGEARHHLTLSELERSLARDGRVSDAALAQVKSETSGYPALPSVGVRPISLIPASLSRALGVVVVSENPLTVALVEDLPDSLATLYEHLKQRFAVKVCTLAQFIELFRATYENVGYFDRPPLTDIYAIFDAAVKKRASDIHLSVGRPPALRVEGSLVDLPYQNVDQPWMRSEMARLLGVERLARAEREYNVDMAFPYGATRFRLNVGMDRNGLTLTARKIPSKVPTPEEIGLPPVVQNFASLDRGLVLVTGPTGSGKSTTLAALLGQISRHQSRHIITLEDPIEFILPPGASTVNQRELGSSFTSFADGLRQALRQDPDVILVGEMRDEETIRTAITAAETGHLVFGTLHTYDASSTLTRIVAVFPPEEQEQIRSMLGYIMKGIVSQTLLPTLSGEGRSAAFEIMVVNSAIANNLRKVDGMSQLRQIIETSTREGMQTMDIALADLVRRRVVSEEVALEKVVNIDDFRKRLQG